MLTRSCLAVAVTQCELFNKLHVLLLPLPADIHYTSGYHVALSGCGVEQNQSGGLYEEALATNVSSCHKSPVKKSKSNKKMSIDTSR